MPAISSEGTSMTTQHIALARGPVRGSVRVPGSKSITNRALLLAALADGPSTIDGALFSDDSRWFVDGLRRLGVAVEADEAAGRVVVQGAGGAPPAERADLWVELAGTAARFLLAYCCLGHGRFSLDGNARMRQRPMADLLETLGALGADCRALGPHGGLPIEVRAAGLGGGPAGIRGDVSSQFLSALLMVAPYAERSVELTLTTPLAAGPYVDITVAMMESFGARVERRGYEWFRVAAGQRYRPLAYAVEPDASSASYFFAAAALTGGRVRVEGLSAGAIQGDIRFLDVLERMGCAVTRASEWVEVQGPPQLLGLDIDLSALPDMTITLAALAPFASGPTTIRNVALIRHHETDRIAACVEELRKLGVAVEERADGLTILPGWKHGATLDAHHDHRMAMGFALSGLKIPGVSISGAECVAKTFPDFFERFAEMTADRRPQTADRSEQ
jgi:3-phosphoshikimate 1-carboxyvinyltransferase